MNPDQELFKMNDKRVCVNSDVPIKLAALTNKSKKGI